MISDFKIFRKNASETTEFWCIVGLTAIIRLLQRKKIHFFYCCYVKEGLALKIA